MSATRTPPTPSRKPWTKLLFAAVALAALAWLLWGCGTTGNASVTLGPGDTITFGGAWSSPTKTGAARSWRGKVLPDLPGHYRTNAAGLVTVTLTNAAKLTP
jgi:hypothetical protein